jgi:hypothetical protein
VRSDYSFQITIQSRSLFLHRPPTLPHSSVCLYLLCHPRIRVSQKEGPRVGILFHANDHGSTIGVRRTAAYYWRTAHSRFADHCSCEDFGIHKKQSSNPWAAGLSSLGTNKIANMALGGHDVSEHLCLGGLVALRRKEWVEGGAVGAPWFRTALISFESAAPEFD